MKKKIFISIIIVFLILVFYYFPLLKYVLKMGYNQFSIVLKARPIEDILSDSNTVASIKMRLQYVEEIKSFAIDSIGLKKSKNYQSLYDQKNKPLLWNVSACKPFSFQAMRWSFPFIGSFPYKGFFDLEDAKLEAKYLKKNGWDVHIRSVSAWSTLGWFSDPILSNMLLRTDGELAELIIHELTHATIFINDSISFNENLATFVGEEGAKRFLLFKYGLSSIEYQNYINSNSDYERFIKHMLQGAKRLDTLYQKSDFILLPDSLKRERKKNTIQKIISSIDTISFFNKKNFSLSKTFQPNNAYFMSFIRYNMKKNSFRVAFKKKYKKNFPLYLNYLKKKYQHF